MSRTKGRQGLDAAADPGRGPSVALITGGSRGIGRAIVEELASQGHTVHFTWREQEVTARRLAEEIAERSDTAVFPHRLDVRDAAACHQLVDEIIEKEGRLNVLVNNAGILRMAPFQEQTEEDWHEILSIHLDGARHLCLAVLREMRDERSGVIVNMSSIAGVLGTPGLSGYATSKGALIAFTKSLAREVARDGIQVHAVAPGLIDTDMFQSMSEQFRTSAIERVPMGRLGRPEEVAALVGFLASGRCAYTTGHVFFVDGGFAI